MDEQYEPFTFEWDAQSTYSIIRVAVKFGFLPSDIDKTRFYNRYDDKDFVIWVKREALAKYKEKHS